MFLCGDVLHSFAVLLFLFMFLFHLWQLHRFFFLNRVAVGNSVCWGTWARQVTAFWNFCLRHSLSEKVLLTSRTATQCGQVSPLHLPPLSLLMRSVIYNPLPARHFASKVVNWLCNSSSRWLLGVCRSSSCTLWLCGSGKVEKRD